MCLLAEKSSLAAAAAVYIPACLQLVKLCLGDPIDFMSWFLNALHTALNGSRKLSSSVINKTFRGKSFSLLGGHIPYCLQAIIAMNIYKSF